MIVAQKLNIPMYGVNLPHHFVLCFLDTSTFQRWEDYKKAEILCYINPYIGGKLFNYTQIDKLLNELSLPQLSMYYRPCDNRSILVRICNNLIDHFKDGGFEQEMNEVIELRTIIQNQSE
jgi:regulator of sirC expression with transglutaminase-like and TPR domain